jgi:S1-C subfamily serine protease
VLLPKLEAELPRSLAVDGSDGQAHNFAPDAWVPGAPFVIGSAGITMAPPATAGAPAQGDWVVAVAVATSGNPSFRPGVFNGSAEANCGLVGEKFSTTIPLSADMSGAGVFDLDARLLGVVLSCDEGMAVIPVTEIQRASRASLSEPLLARYGMAVTGDLTVWKLRDPRASGVVVTEVWSAWPSDTAGIEPGDFIIAVDGQAIGSEQQAQQLLSAQGAHALELRRARRAVRVSLQSVSAMQPALEGASLDEPAPGIGVTHVNAGSSAARAGIRSGDRILEIDGIAATRASVGQAITPYTATSPAVVVLQRGARKLAVMVTP